MVFSICLVIHEAANVFSLCTVLSPHTHVWHSLQCANPRDPLSRAVAYTVFICRAKLEIRVHLGLTVTTGAAVID